jgi:hypothetical protein
VKDIVLIPTYNRAEYLNLCLEYLANTIRTQTEKEFWVCQDFRQNDDHRYRIQMSWVDEVIAKYRGPLTVHKFTTVPHNYIGNSFNVLESYKKTFSTDARFVYLVEDDVMVRPDFFVWHENVQEVEPDAMCSIAYRCSRNHEARTDVVDPGAYFTTARDYASIGVCWKKENLLPLLEHGVPAYYNDMDGYIGRQFPGNRFSTDFCEQDGLVMRCMWNERTFTAWPYVPRAYHIGFRGYHRPNGFSSNGFWQQKSDALRAIIHDPVAVKNADRDFGDIEVVPNVTVEPWQKLIKIQHFD